MDKVEIMGGTAHINGVTFVGSNYRVTGIQTKTGVNLTPVSLTAYNVKAGLKVPKIAS